MMKRDFSSFGLVLFLISMPFAIAEAQEFDGKDRTIENSQVTLSLEECIDRALQNNRFRPVAKYAIEIAEAQHQQALSGYWPQLSLKASYTRMDENPNFVVPSFTMSALALPLPIAIPPITVPEQNIQLMDKQNFLSSLDLIYPLYTGGMISAIAKQAECGVEVAKQDAKSTDLRMIYDVKRIYYGVVLARELHRLGEEALARLEVTLELTESLYKKGSGKVQKTDYLKNKVIVEGVRSLVALLQDNEKIAKVALVNAIGQEWDTTIEPAETEIPFKPYQIDVTELVNGAYLFNPDWAKLKAGQMAAEAKIGEAKSGYLPKLALVGNLNHIDNSYDYGVVSSRNKDSWIVGLSMELPLFSGFRSMNKVREARARLHKIEEQKVLLREGIALQIQQIFLQMVRAQEQERTAGEAMKAAEENRTLTERAYQEGLAEVKDLVEAQLLESFMKAQYQKVLYDHIETQAHLDYIIGKEVIQLLHLDR